MTKKHFEAMAAMFKKNFDTNQALLDMGMLTIAEKTERDTAVVGMRRDFCTFAASENPRFDAEKFRQATI